MWNSFCYLLKCTLQKKCPCSFLSSYLYTFTSISLIKIRFMCFVIRRKYWATVSFDFSAFVPISLHARILSLNNLVSLLSQKKMFIFNCVTYMQRRAIRNNWLPWTNFMHRDLKTRHRHYKLSKEKEKELTVLALVAAFETIIIVIIAIRWPTKTMKKFSVQSGIF